MLEATDAKNKSLSSNDNGRDHVYIDKTVRFIYLTAYKAYFIY